MYHCHMKIIISEELVKSISTGLVQPIVVRKICLEQHQECLPSAMNAGYI